MSYYTQTNYPDIFLENDINNPVLHSPDALYSISFGMNREQSYDFEEYRNLIDHAIREFRHSRTYSHYKAYIMSLGLNMCQFHPNIQNTNAEENMASLEMHHCMLTIYDIACLIAEHYLNCNQVITEFDISELLRLEHVENRIPITMLCKTCHQQYHHSYLYIHPEMIFGKWWELFDRYPKGITKDIAYKVIMYLNQACKEKFERKKETAEKLLKLRENLINWSNIL